MQTSLLALAALTAAEEQAAPADSPVRTAVRILLWVLIAGLLAYIVIEQIGYWFRGRSGRG